MEKLKGVTPKQPLALHDPKTCKNCGKVFAEVPALHVAATDPSYFVGYYWNCDCGSTMFAPLEKVSRAS